MLRYSVFYNGKSIDRLIMVFAHFCIQSSPEPGVMLINHIIEQLTVLYLVNKEESMEVENREKC